MIYHCAKCTFKGGYSDADMFEGVDTVMVHCPVCGQLLAEYAYEELEQVHQQGEQILDSFLPTPDQCRYSLHLYQKQIGKLENAKAQLEGMIAKTEIMLEIARERLEGRG